MRWLMIFMTMTASSHVFAQMPPDKAAELFDPKAPPLKIELTFDKANADKLRQDPRRYVLCTFKAGDVTLNDVAIHIKGAAGSSRGFDDKPAFTINFDKMKKDQRFFGLDKLHLNNSVQDGSYYNELIAADQFKRAGLPAARFTHVRVEINGRKVGMYMLKEGYDKTFLKRYFPDASGNLYDGGFLQDIDAPLKQDSGSGKEHKDLKVLLAACREGDAKKRWDAIQKNLDVDRFVTMCAMETLLCDWDGYARNRNNYRLYHDPKTDKFVFIPHGKDQLFQNAGDGLWHGWQGIVSNAVLNHPEGKKLYITKMNQLAKDVFTIENMNKVVDDYLPRAKEIAGKIDPNWPKGFEGEANNVKNRIKERVNFVNRELKTLK